MSEQVPPTQEFPMSGIDADHNGHLAMGLFVGVILILLVFIYAFASAA